MPPPHACIARSLALSTSRANAVDSLHASDNRRLSYTQIS